MARLPKRRPQAPRQPGRGLTALDFASWASFDRAARERAAELMRPAMRDLARGMGARSDTEVRSALEMIVQACRAELEQGRPPGGYRVATFR